MSRFKKVKDLCKLTLETIEDLECDEESIEKFRERFDDPEEWEIVRDSELHLCMSDNCFYNGNSDGCIIFKIRGFYLCDMCVDNLDSYIMRNRSKSE